MKNSHLDRRSKYSLQVIRSALFELLEEKDLKNITVTDICKLADVNRGTFYKYYDDVPDLFSKIEMSVVSETCDVIKADCLEHFSIEKLLSNILNIIVDNKDLTYMLAKSPTETQYLQELIQTFRPELIETMLANIPDLTKDMSDVCFDFILGGVVNLILQWVKKEMNIPVRQMETILARLIYSVLNAEVYKNLDQ